MVKKPPSQAMAEALVGALVRCGVHEVFYCPGSRDAPLAYALDKYEKTGLIRVFVRLDERGAAFQALGAVKGAAAIGELRAVAVVTTSGTAAANLHPALCEADAAGVPLIAVTADRPHEMWGTGANQTTAQLGMYGQAMRFEADIPAGFPVDERLSSLVKRALLASVGALTGNPGPAHLNVCFREPLVPAYMGFDTDFSPEKDVFSEFSHVFNVLQPTLLNMPAHTAVVAGDCAGDDACCIAREGNWPLFAEPSSGALYSRNAITNYQELLLGPLAERIEGVVVIGHPTLSRPVSRLLSRMDIPIVAVAQGSRWTDVAGVAELATGRVAPAQTAEDAWLASWLTADVSEPEKDKDKACQVIWEAHAVAGAPGLVIGASDVIRAFDKYARPTDYSPLVVANRGLAGIDGTLSTAVGVSIGTGSPTRAVVGDLTFTHDSLGLLRGEAERDIDVQVIVLADRGGAIFSGLEHGQAEPELFSRYFSTPQQLDISHCAAAQSIPFMRITDVAELPDVLAKPIKGRSIVEVMLA